MDRILKIPKMHQNPTGGISGYLGFTILYYIKMDLLNIKFFLEFEWVKPTNNTIPFFKPTNNTISVENLPQTY